MSNILPPDVRSTLVRVQKARFVFVVGGALSFVACVAILSILPAFLATYFPRAALEAGRSVNEGEDAQIQADRDAAAKTRLLLGALEPVLSPHARLASIVSTVNDARPSTVMIQNISYRAGPPGTLVIIGTTRSRDDVAVFRDTLARDTRFTQVTVPVAALIGSLAGDFTMTINGSF